MTRFVVFIAIAMGLLAGIHYYLWIAVGPRSAASDAVERFVTVSLALLGGQPAGAF